MGSTSNLNFVDAIICTMIAPAQAILETIFSFVNPYLVGRGLEPFTTDLFARFGCGVE